MADVRISARSTLTALNRWVEVISGNLVGSQITGYKATRVTFGDSLVDVLRGGSGNAVSLGGINPVQVASGGITIGGTTTDFRQGSLLQTGNNSDVSIQGNAFFTIADSSGKIIYTRSGEFNFDDQGYLVNKEGGYVLGVYDKSRPIVKQASYRDVNTLTSSGISIKFDASPLSGYDPRTGITVGNGTGLASNAYGLKSIFGDLSNPQLNAEQTIFNYFVDPTKLNQDRVIGRTYVPGGQLYAGEVAAGQNWLACASTGGAVAGTIIGTIGGISINLFLPDQSNLQTRTSSDNARLIAAAINSRSNDTGIGCSVVVNLNDQTQATLVLGPVNRMIGESAARMPTDYANPTAPTAAAPAPRPLDLTLTTNETGLVKTTKDNKGNRFYQMNAMILSAGAPLYQPSPGDIMHFDSTGALINDSRGKDPTSAPPVNTGVHIALSKFSNVQGLEKRRGGSQFLYTEATGVVATGYAGMSKVSQIANKTSIEQDGVSSIGAENVVIAQSLESSNSSVTDSLPELTVAQKTLTSNTKVVNVCNTIVDDLNGLIR